MADRPMVSAAALSTFQAYLPGDLTPTQADKVLQAAGEMAKQVWQEAVSSQAVLTAVRNEYHRAATPTEEN